MAGMVNDVGRDSPVGKSRLLTILVWLLCTVFIAVALTRRLNFDEWLVLRAGWLLANNEPTALHFLMPFTWTVGVFASAVADVSIAVVVPRLFIAILVAGSLWWSLRQNLSVSLAQFAFIACMTCGAFLSHAIEFRYDAVILCAWLLAWGLLARPSHLRYVLVGAITCLLILHHTKGMFYAFSLSAYLVLMIRPQYRDYLRLVAGFMAVLLLWLLVLGLAGLYQEQFEIYRQFSALAVSFGHVDPWHALGGRFMADLVWWLIVLPLLALALWKGRAGQLLMSTLWFGVTPLVFILLHPRPWDYMVTPLIPFAAAIAVIGGRYLLENTRLKTVAGRAVLVPLLAWSLAGAGEYVYALGITNHRDLDTLGWLQRVVVTSDVVLDPSGAAYFIKPVAPDWYLDTLFRSKVADGTWMQETRNNLDRATVVVDSYRLRWLPEEDVAHLQKSHVPVCSWLWLRRGDARIPSAAERCSANDGAGSLQNFWGR